MVFYLGNVHVKMKGEIINFENKEKGFYLTIRLDKHPLKANVGGKVTVNFKNEDC